MSIKRAQDNKLDLGIPPKWEKDFTFIQAADCQLGMEWSCKGEGGYGQGKGYEPNYDNATWYHELRWCNTFVDMINKTEPRPKFVVICGDILDAWPHKWPEVRDRQKKDWTEIFSKLEVPLVCVCGNHDVGNKPTVDTVRKYREDFGDDWFSFVCAGVFFIVINSQYYEYPDNVLEIAAEHEAWLDVQLEIAKSQKYKHSVILQHIPWFLKKPDEPKVYYNFPQELREKMLKKFSDSGIGKIFCGHYHRNGGGWYDEKLELIVTSAIGLQQGKDRNGFRVVNVTESVITHQYIELENIDPPMN